MILYHLLGLWQSKKKTYLFPTRLLIDKHKHTRMLRRGLSALRRVSPADAVTTRTTTNRTQHNAIVSSSSSSSIYWNSARCQQRRSVCDDAEPLEDEVKVIKKKELWHRIYKKLQKKDSFVLLDVRLPKETRWGVIHTAHNIPCKCTLIQIIYIAPPFPFSTSKFLDYNSSNLMFSHLRISFCCV